MYIYNTKLFILLPLHQKKKKKNSLRQCKGVSNVESMEGMVNLTLFSLLNAVISLSHFFLLLLNVMKILS